MTRRLAGIFAAASVTALALGALAFGAAAALALPGCGGCGGRSDAGATDASGDASGDAAAADAGNECWTGDVPAIDRDVYLLVLDPVLEAQGGVRLTEYLGWSDPMALASMLVDWWWATSDCRVTFRLAVTVVADAIPPLVDGFVYDDASYLAVVADPSTAHLPDGVDYLRLLEDYQVCEMANAGAIDELWVFGGPWFGFYESRLAGPGSFAYNSPPLLGSACTVHVPVMGFNYERGLNEAIHDFGHRTEATMTHVYGGWAEDRIAHDWDRFGLVAAQSPSFGFGGCGSVHWAPTSLMDYQYDNATPVMSMCEDFVDYPALSADPALALMPVTCSAWGCTERGYYEWWFRHLPHAPGADPEGRLHDWWSYAMDPQTYFDEPPAAARCTDRLSSTACDLAAPRCTWYACAGRCLGGGADATGACGCLANPDIPACDATAGCAWYACVEACLPNATPLAGVCE